MTQEEKEEKIREMQDYAKKMDQDKNIKLFGSKEAPDRATLDELIKEQE